MRNFVCNYNNIAVVLSSLVSILCPHADIINSSRNNNNIESHLVYVITGSVVGSATLLLCVLFVVAAVICIKLCFKKSATLSQDGPDLSVYDSITSPVYKCFNPTVLTSVMTENEAYDTCCKNVRAYEII